MMKMRLESCERPQDERERKKAWDGEMRKTVSSVLMSIIIILRKRKNNYLQHKICVCRRGQGSI
jgi:hypothetical protein